MPLILLERRVYKLTPRQFTALQQFQATLVATEPERQHDLCLHAYFDEHKNSYKIVGDLDFDFRL